MWRGDLSPLGYAVAPKSTDAETRHTAFDGFGAATLPNGDKSPRHRARSHMVSGVSLIAQPGTLATFFPPTNTSTRLKERTHGMV